MDPYATLGVDRDASPETVKAAFRKKAAATHPDHGGNAEAFKDVVRANAVLSNPETRKRYDSHGELPPDGAAVDPDHVARQIIANMVSGMIDKVQDTLTDKDLVYVMRENLRAAIRSHEEAIAGLRQKIARAEKLKGRFTRKKKKSAGANLMEGVIAGKITEFRRGIEANEQAMALPRRAMEILEDYEFRAEPVQQMTMNSFSFGGFTGSSSTGGF